MRIKSLISALAAAATVLITPSVFSQGYPTKPVLLLVPYAPGGSTDLIARVVTSKIAGPLGQPMVVENKGGGGGVIGATQTARAAPDGYSLGMATVSTVATLPAIQPATPYKPLTDFTPIINIAATPNIIAVNPSFPAKDYKEFLAELKKNPGKYTHASSGTGAINHMQMELFKSLTGTTLTHIPYRGAGPALNDVIAGQVPIIFTQVAETMPYIKQGRLVPIVVAAPERLKELPNVPTFKEVGLEPVNRMAFYGFYGPKGLPKEVVEKVNGAVKKTLEDPTVRKRIEESGSIIIGGTPEQFAEQIKAEYDIYKKVVADQKLKLEE